MVRVRRKHRAKPVLVARDFTDADIRRMRELVAEGFKASRDRAPYWEQELEVIHHIRGRVRNRVGWLLGTHQGGIGEALAQEIADSVPADGQGLDWRFGAKYCNACEGLIHWCFHIVGDRYTSGCPQSGSAPTRGAQS